MFAWRFEPCRKEINPFFIMKKKSFGVESIDELLLKLSIVEFATEELNVIYYKKKYFRKISHNYFEKSIIICIIGDFYGS